MKDGRKMNFSQRNHLSEETLNRHLPDRLRALLEARVEPRYITPLFWQHGEARDVLLEEIEQMHSVGVNGFILESRPFPEFLESAWWETVGFILNEARKRHLKVFVFDDIKFPSGFAADRVRKHHPEYLKLYLRENHLDAIGPLPGASFRLSPWMGAEERLVRVLTVPVSDDGGQLEMSAATDVTDRVNQDGILFWDVPSGRQRIFLFIQTREGGERHTKDYLNPLDPEPVKAYLDEVYEPHFLHFSEYFGKTFAGFFSDEPRFGSAESYAATLGKLPMVLPFSEKLFDHLNAAWNGDFTTMLPCLWYDGGDITARARSTYMDVVSRRYAENYTRQIGDWCRRHQVKSIGHLVEDNGAHARLGYGTGHFFRAIHGQDWSGMDAVLLQLLPGYTSGIFPSSYGPIESEFAYWGVTKLASSAGHLDPKKQGTTFCEAFGAYGWQEGLKLMKWFTDHFCVRGVNHLIPHAFSPKEFPDPDCPPHFYARGNNPQWRYFRTWSDYANRVCHLLSDGRHVATAAVVYHAEAEWTGGKYDPFEKVVKALAQRQLDCDVVPIDSLLDRSQAIPSAAGLQINDETYQIVIVPYAECLPEALLERLNEFAGLGLRIVFMRNLPKRGVATGQRGADILAKLRAHPLVTVSEYDTLAEQLLAQQIYDIRTASSERDLYCYHYVRPGEDIYFFVNGSTLKTIETHVLFNQTDRPVGYNPLNNSIYQPAFNQTDAGAMVEMCLEPYQSTFIIFSKKHDEIAEALPDAPLKKKMRSGSTLDGPWQIGMATAKEFPAFKSTPHIAGLGNISAPGCLPSFSGTIRYETGLEWQDTSGGDRIFLDLGELYETAAVTLNGQLAGVCITPPYRVEITAYLRNGINNLQIDVTNTLAKQFGDNIFDRSIPHEPSGLIGPVQIWRLPLNNTSDKDEPAVLRGESE